MNPLNSHRFRIGWRSVARVLSSKRQLSVLKTCNDSGGIKMQSLYNADVYTDEVREMILESGHIGIEIANRWMMGWPKRVVNLMIQDMYEDVFQNQLLQEQDAIARASNLSHLAPMEIVVMSGLNLEPPEV